jgi:hypothetical protein
MTLDEWLVLQARIALKVQKEDGSLPAGCNGPYGHVERPVRNTAHALSLFTKAHRLTGETIFAQAAGNAVAYCCSPADCPQGANHWHRSVQSRDQCNGTIGAAWVIEGLCDAAAHFGWEKARDEAARLFHGHRQESKWGLWHRWESDGSELSLDMTFNHQLWLAMAGGLLAELGDTKALSKVECFFRGLSQTFVVQEDGLICHRIRLSWMDRLKEPGSPLFALYHLLDPSRRKARGPMNFAKRDIGYHAFNMYAFARLRGSLPEASFWTSTSFLQAVAFLGSSRHKEGVADNPYAFPYNPVGFEAACALQTFCPAQESERGYWINRQIHELGREDYGSGVADPSTARARVYEACLLKDFPLDDN